MDDFGARQAAFHNRLDAYATVFDDVPPWAGKVPADCLADFTGAFTPRSMTGTGDPRFCIMSGADSDMRAVQTRPPRIEDGEAWFEALNWVVAAREARDRFVMMTLGALYGAQIVSGYRALQSLNPMPCMLVGVEPAPENYEWTRRNLELNGIKPSEFWLVPHALSDSATPVLFPVGTPLAGGRNAISTNEHASREAFVAEFLQSGPEATAEALRNLLLHNTTGLTRQTEDARGEMGGLEIKMVSAMTLGELLAPFSRVDYIEADIQQSEIVVFPPFIELLSQRVRRIHIGTHGRDVHWGLHDLFATHGWEIVFSFQPDAEHHTSLGTFRTGDGVLTVVNPRLALNANGGSAGGQRERPFRRLFGGFAAGKASFA
jgi:hypothetical protein